MDKEMIFWVIKTVYECKYPFNNICQITIFVLAIIINKPGHVHGSEPLHEESVDELFTGIALYDVIRTLLALLAVQAGALLCWSWL